MNFSDKARTSLNIYDFPRLPSEREIGALDVKSRDQSEQAYLYDDFGKTNAVNTRTGRNNSRKNTKCCCTCIKDRMKNIPDAVKNLFCSISYMGLFKAILSLAVFINDFVSTLSYRNIIDIVFIILFGYLKQFKKSWYTSFKHFR